MKRIGLLIVFYCLIHRASGDFAVSYEGMDQDTVTKTVQQAYGPAFNFVNEATYNAFVAAHQPKLPVPVLAPSKGG